MNHVSASRRAFLQTSAGLAAAGAAGICFPWTQSAVASASPNARPRLASIGVGGMGKGDARGHRRFADIVAICDVDRRHAEQAKADERINAPGAELYGDYRRVLDRNDVDVVSIATPDHWHVKIAIEALEAGKHIFCQKPLTLTLEENQLVRAACRKHKGRVFFIGTQQRSSRDKFLRAINMVQQGLLGDIRKVTVGINGSPTGGPFKTSDVPSPLDWDSWLGQAPKVDYIAERCHGKFRWWYEYSGGKFTDWGAHHIDIASWALNELGEGQGPVEIDGTDANHPVDYKDGYATVTDSFNTSHDFAVKCRFASGVQMVVESRGDNGILFEGSKGRIFVNRSKITGVPIEENWDKDVYGPEQLTELFKGKPAEGHKDNFYRCISEGGLPVSDVFSHLQVMNSCHLCSIAARLQRKIQWDPATETIVGDPLAASLAAREQRKGYEILKV
ncbi:MAG: Gfo/Idh/MocA family oxidoreductase [Planctomycetaceae bacterium]|nr:Gfo/Idh/MocA family oxidoreductase [Planctomycetaceae bacterium]